MKKQPKEKHLYEVIRECDGFRRQIWAVSEKQAINMAAYRSAQDEAKFAYGTYRDDGITLDDYDCILIR